MINRWLLLVGALQGWALWGLWKARELKVWPALDPLSERALLYVALALPLAFYFTQNVAGLARSRRIRILLGIGLVFALLGGYSGWAENVAVNLSDSILRIPPARPSDLFAAAILGFVALPLLTHFDGTTRRWPYHALFETAWRNALMTASSGGMVGVFWIVLFAGAMLMKSIGLNFVFDLIEKPIFSIPATGIAFGAAFALGLARVEMIVTLRRFWLSVSMWLLPLLLGFAVVWVVALPFTGLDLLFKTHSAGLILLWFLALSINFANAAYQDGSIDAPYGRWLSRALEFAWLALLVIAVVAGWALKLRVDQYGWTEERVWAAFVLAMTSFHTLGYAVSLRRGTGCGWLADIGRTNVAGALLLSLGLALLLSPIADARKIAVRSQMSRLVNGVTPTDKIDYAYLRWEAGRYGSEALNTLAAGIEHKDRATIIAKATQTLAQKQRYGSETGASALTTEQIRQRLRVLPPGEKLSDALISTIQSASEARTQSSNWQERRCLATDAECLVWMIDLDGDGLKEAVVIITKPAWQTGTAIFYQQTAADRFKYGGTLNLAQGADARQREKFLADIEAGKVEVVAPKFNDLVIAGRRVNVIADND
ncbi:MAG: DUF4153 domain-containing protein [Propionivibrio sp.]